jgi:UDP-glucose 4-epimerase
VNLYNLGCESTTNVKTIAEMVVEQMGLEKVRFKFTGGDRGWKGDVPQVRFNIEKIKKIGWNPTLSSDQAVLSTIKSLIQEIVEEKVCRW